MLQKPWLLKQHPVFKRFGSKKLVECLKLVEFPNKDRYISISKIDGVLNEQHGIVMGFCTRSTMMAIGWP
jgi:hypothetical protein